MVETDIQRPRGCDSGLPSDNGDESSTNSRVLRQAPLSPIQRDLYLHSLIYPDSNTFNIALSLELGAGVDEKTWRAALEWVVQRDDILRTSIIFQDGEPVQVVNSQSPISFTYVNLAQSTPPGRSTRQYLWDELPIPIDLSSPPLIRNYLIRDDRKHYTAAFVSSHILLDGFGARIFFERIVGAYSALLEGASPEQADFPSYYAYAEGDYPPFDRPETEKYWSGQFANTVSLDLSQGSSRDQGHLVTKLCLGPEETAEIKDFCERQGHRLPGLFLALYALLLQRYGDCNEDFVVFTLLAGRSERYRQTIGVFYQVLPYLFSKERFDDHAAISEVVDYIRRYRKDLGGHENISYPLANKLLRNPKLKCFFNYHSFNRLNVLGEARAMGIFMFHPEDEVHLHVTDVGDSIELELFYHETSFTNLAFLERLRHVTLQVCRNARIVSDLEILLDGEGIPLSAAHGAPAQTPQTSTPVHRKVEEHASRRPDGPAVIVPALTDGGAKQERRTVTYRELNERANKLAHHLQSLGVGPDVLVALCVERSVELVVAILAVLKAGGAYVPLDPDYPRDGLDFVMKDSASRVLITQDLYREWFTADDRHIVCVDGDRDTINRQDTGNPAAGTDSDNLAYAIYTSGSTGRPKGVLLTHGNVSRLFESTDHWFGFSDSDVWTMFHSCAFDFSVWELWGALVHGGRLVVVPKAVSRSPAAFHNLLSRERVTVLNQTPSAFYHLMAVDGAPGSDRTLSLRYVIFGGEALNLAALRPWVARHGDDSPRLINMYGITETTVHVTYRPLTREDIYGRAGSAIGGAIPDLRIYILDKRQRPMPAGLVGEICVAGAGVARGYLNRPELTAERFIVDPFTMEPGARLYRSGDLGRILADGDIEYLGRIDDQVKIRGFRVELGEINTVLAAYPAVAHATVVADIRSSPSGDSGPSEARLVAYVVPTSGGAPSVREIREHLSQSLPDHMVPSSFVFLDNIPLTDNGKVDRDALPPAESVRPDLERPYVPARTQTEQRLVESLQQILGVERVGIHDDFFELGGHSLAAAQLAARVRRDFGVNLCFANIFEAPTVAELSGRLSDRALRASEPLPLVLEPVPRDEPLLLSFSQERIWFLLQLNPENRAYEFQATLRFQGRLAVPVLEQCLTEILRRHEIYRTSFPAPDGRPHQKIHEPWSISLPVIDLSARPAGERARATERHIRQSAAEPFELERPPLVRWSLIGLSPHEHILVHFEHHIIHDGWSFVVFLRELLALYRAFAAGRPSPLEEPRIQFADFAHCQRQWMTGDAMLQQLEYWKTTLADCPALLDLPTDRARPPMQSFRGDAVRFDLPRDLAEDVGAFARKRGATVYMTMLTAYFVLLNRYSRQDDIVVGTGVANRRLRETEELMGMIINNVAIRCDLTGDPSFHDLLRRVRTAALGAYEHQDVPFDRVVEAVNPQRNASYSPIFQTIFTSYDGPMPALGLPGLTVTLDEGLNNGTAKFDLNVVIISRPKEVAAGSSGDSGGAISIIWEYNSDLFSRETAQRMIAYYQAILRYGIANGDAHVSDIPLLSPVERRQFLGAWAGAASDYPREATITSLFETVAGERPEATAVVFGERALRYRELNDRANRLAHYLRGSGVGPEAPVGLCLERGLDLVVAVLAILKAGGAYVPLDPDYPSERLGYMLADSAAAVLVTRSELQRVLPAFDGPVVCLDRDRAAIDLEPSDNPVVAATASALAYVIYTSGSTGRPKGTRIEHRAVVRLVKETNYVELGPGEVILQFAPISFDASTFELWGALLNGAKLAVMAPGVPSLEDLAAALREHRVTTLWLTAALFHQMVDSQLGALQGVRQILAGGEVLSVAHVKRMLAVLPAGHRLINGYGPTENTTFTACHVMTADSEIGRSVPIGRPISNTRVYILDGRRRPVPIGVAGELYIGGDGLARDYLNRPELTRECFVQDPFSRDAGERLYRTGDVARYLADGTIEFLGRIDRQVKLRGFRIELDEIAAVLGEHPAVDQTYVLLREDQPGDKRLVAYVVAAEGELPTEAQLRQHLSNSLPTYMVPSSFVLLDNLPLTPVGKVDREALPAGETQGPDLAAAFLAPRSETEKAIAAIWKDLLGRSQVSVHDDFFALGGHSLLATQVMTRIGKTLGVRLAMRQLFENPTICGLAACVERAHPAGTVRGAPPASDSGAFERGEI